jgi:hypothetical protein
MNPVLFLVLLIVEGNFKVVASVIVQSIGGKDILAMQYEIAFDMPHKYLHIIVGGYCCK